MDWINRELGRKLAARTRRRSGSYYRYRQTNDGSDRLVRSAPTPGGFSGEVVGKLISTIIDEQPDERERASLRADGDRPAGQVATVSSGTGGRRGVRNRTEHEHE